MVPALSDLLTRISPAVVAAAAGSARPDHGWWWRCGSGAGAGAPSRPRPPRSGSCGRSPPACAKGVIAYDMDLQLTFVNPAFERLTGYVAEDIRDQEFLQYVHPDDRPALLAEWPRLADGGALRDQEYRVVTRAGQERWCASAWEPIRDEAGPAGRLPRHRVRHHRAQARRGRDAARHRAVPGGDRGAAGGGRGRARFGHGHAGHRRAVPGAHRRHRGGGRADPGRRAGPPGHDRHRESRGSG